ncbi:hypothetical protein ACHHYP_10491 [Achlya hypogyna]|uniref:Protein phosphatase n=1 Tax=Achlya hypogyna TaxID=1202772 RepID=A0A1V9YLE3_ACHHY|nr:hypothetical protein ACHHYP_10491 [Achlya hypogyna]
MPGWNRRMSEVPVQSTPSLHNVFRKGSVVTPAPIPPSDRSSREEVSTLGASPSQPALRTSGGGGISAMRRFSRVLLGRTDENESPPAPRRKSSLRAMTDLFSTSFKTPTKTDTGHASHVEHGLDAGHADRRLLVLADGSLDAELPSMAFAKELVASVVSHLGPYVVSDDFSHDCSPLQLSVALRELLLEAIRAVRNLPLFSGTEQVAEAVLSVAVVQAGTKTAAPRLFSFTIGDAKTLVVRNGALVFESAALIHGFNTPACVASQLLQSFENDCLYECFPLEPKDTVVLVSDGVADNVYGHELLAALASEAGDCQAAADAVLRVAVANFDHPLNGHSPFSMAASTELYRQVDTNPEQMAKYSEIIQKDTNLKCNPLTRFASTFLGEHYELEILAMLASAKTGHSDDATVLITAV